MYLSAVQLRGPHILVDPPRIKCGPYSHCILDRAFTFPILLLLLLLPLLLLLLLLLLLPPLLLTTTTTTTTTRSIHGLNPLANYTDRATAACRRS
jgi:hypothetical protein